MVSKMAWGIGWTFIRALKSEKLYFDGFLLYKAYNVSARKCQRNYVSWHWKVMQNLKENWLVAWKMTKETWLIFMRAVECLKICALIGCLCPKHTKWKYERVMSHDTEEWFKVWRKKMVGSKNDMRNLVNFNAYNGKPENMHFDVLLLPIAYKISAKKVH